jgi:hypothetical protein
MDLVGVSQLEQLLPDVADKASLLYESYGRGVARHVYPALFSAPYA